jgi:DNA-directed RNA polymerase subunit RPC12/RpoP
MNFLKCMICGSSLKVSQDPTIDVECTNCGFSGYKLKPKVAEIYVVRKQR